jgi:hypothetical protein
MEKKTVKTGNYGNGNEIFGKTIGLEFVKRAVGISRGL